MIPFRSNKNIYISISLIILLLLNCSEKKINEIEPNNSFPFANMLQNGSTFYGYIDSKDDSDFFKIEITEDTILDVYLSGVKGINHSIQIWRGSLTPELLKLIDDGRKSSPERIANLYVSPGIYYISIQHGERDKKIGNKEIPYQLTIKQRAPVNEEREPNDTLLTANKIILDSEITGFYSPSYNKMNLAKDNPLREEDWYYIEINENETFPLALHVTLSGVNDINAEICILNSTGEKIACANKASTGSGEELKNIGIGEPGIYYICAASKGYKSNPDLPYSLDVRVTAVDKNLELENNNTFSKSNYIIDDSISGSLEDGTDKDIFLYQYSQGDFFRIELIPLENCDIKMTLYDLNKNLLFDINNAGGGIAEVFSNFYTNESFFISVQSNNTSDTESCPYNYIISPLVYDCPIEKEPNDTKQKAMILVENSITGFSSYKNDVDFYIINTPSRAKKSFEITGSSAGSFNFSITDPLGYIIKTITITGDEHKDITEMIDKKAYIIIEHKEYDYKNPYYFTLKD